METENHVPPPPPPREPRRGGLSFWEAVFAGAFALGGGLAIAFVSMLMIGAFATWQSCNVALLPLHGELVSYPNGEIDKTASEDLVVAIEDADADMTVDAIVIDIESPGGYPVAGEEVAHALERATKPTVALIRGMGASAAYWAAIGAETIFASASSDVGSIGVTMSYLDEVEKNKEEGLRWNELTSGEFKSIGDPNKPLTDEERELIMHDINEVRDNFVAAVARRRGLSPEEADALADGSSMTGRAAVEKKLIDRIGDLHDVGEYLKEKTGKDAEWCRYKTGVFF